LEAGKKALDDLSSTEDHTEVYFFDIGEANIMELRSHAMSVGLWAMMLDKPQTRSLQKVEGSKITLAVSYSYDELSKAFSEMSL